MRYSGTIKIVPDNGHDKIMGEAKSGKEAKQRTAKGTKLSRTLEKMRANPQGDWSISDVEKLCKQLGINCSPPSSGSHYKISSDSLHGILTIPARRPIKAPYIRKLVALADAHMEHSIKGQKND